MVISPMIMQSMIKVTASRASATHSTAPDKEPPLIVVLNSNGTVILNTVKMATDLDFAAALAQALGNRVDKSVLLTVDVAALHGRFVQVLDLIKQQGADKISLLRKSGGNAASGGAKKL